MKKIDCISEENRVKKNRPTTILFCKSCGLMAKKGEGECPRCACTKYTLQVPEEKKTLAPQNIIMRSRAGHSAVFVVGRNTFNH